MADVRPLDTSSDGLERASRFLRTAFPRASHLTPAYLRWDYVENPCGAAVGGEVLRDGSLVAHVAGQPFRAELDGAGERGVLVHNVATAAAERGRGLFTELVRHTLDAAREAGFGLVAAVANASSTPVFERLGFQRVRALEARLGVGRPAPPDGDAPVRFRRAWDATELRWRLAVPGRPYVRRGGAVLAPAGPPGVRVELAALDEALLPEEIPREGAPRPVRLWLGLDPRRDWSRRAYVPLPERLRPSPLNLVFLDLTPAGRRLDAEAVRFEAIDFDAY